MVYWRLSIASRYTINISYQETPKKFGGPRGHNWTLRDDKAFMNIVMPGSEGSWTTLKECKRRALLAFMLWFAVKLLRNTDDPKVIDGEFFHV